jgi:hypothetical protein
MRPFAFPFGIVVLSLGISSPALSQSESRPHMDLVRGLRKERMADLALQYLDSLRDQKLDPETQVLLDVEYARTWLELANEETEEGKRNALIAQAKAKLEAFIAANPKHALTVQANIDLAKLYSVQGRTQIRKARRLEEKMEMETAMKEARTPLKAAADKYKAMAAVFDKQIDALSKDKSPANERKRRELVDFRLSAQLDQGITLYYLGETFVGEELKDITEQGNQFKAAKKIFELIRYEDDKLPIRWIAMAWSAQADLKAGDAGASEKTLAELVGRKNPPPAAVAGIRVARYFTILNNFDNSARDYIKLEKDTEAWLKDFPSQRESTEGLGCRYYLAVSKKNNALALMKFDPKTNKPFPITAVPRQKLEQAQQIFKDLENSENEYAERATRYRSQILVTIADADGHGDEPPLESLPNFERAYLMAQVQIARFGQFRAGGSGGKKQTPPSEEQVKKEEKRRYTIAMRYLEHALKLANPPKDSVREIFAARLALVGCYYHLKMYPQGAVLAEHLARENLKMGTAPRAGSAAVTMYNMAQISLKKLRENAPDATEKSWDAAVKADADRLARAARFMVSQWPADTLTDESRHILAFLALREAAAVRADVDVAVALSPEGVVNNGQDPRASAAARADLERRKKYEEGWKALAGIRGGYPALQLARLQLASAMWALIYPFDEKDPAKFRQTISDRLKRYEKEWKQTIALMDSVPAPDDGALESEVALYLDNRAQFARLYQLEDKQEKAQQLGEAIVKEVDIFAKLSAAQKASYKQLGQNLALMAIRAQAFNEFKAGNHARVAELLGPRVAEIEKAFDEKAPAPDELTKSYLDLRKTQRLVVSLALQSCVQDGKIDRAGELLDVLEKGSSADESLTLLQTLVSSVRTQIEQLEADVKNPAKKGEAAAKTTEMTNLKDGFAKLLEKMFARGDKLPLRMRLSLASGLTSVGAYDKAKTELEAFRSQPPPKEPAAGATEEMLEAHRAQLDDYRKYQKTAQLMLARNFRAQKDYPKALGVYKDMIGEVSYKKGVSTAKEKQGWAFRSLNVRKEKAQLLEEMALAEKDDKAKLTRWGEAVQEWIAILTTFTPRLEPRLENLSPADGARKTLFNLLKSKREEGAYSLIELVWLGHQFGESVVRDGNEAAKKAATTAANRELYFDLYFEQKRCSVKAFKDLGTKGTKGDAAALQQKFAGFAKNLVELQSTKDNPDLSQTIKDRIKELVEEVDELKREYKQLSLK